MSDISLTNEFLQACINIKNLSYLPDNDTLLLLYSYYKQATIGDCNTLSPNFWELKETAKYNSWKLLTGFSKDYAMKFYIKKVNEILLKKIESN
jgi:diazepam-binding inhibitor (GABA receptor modulating acyl-CoA-binding protein)